MERQITDARSFWSALVPRATGVAIVTASGENGPSGFLALSATHLAASPPTMTISVALTTSAYADIGFDAHTDSAVTSSVGALDPARHRDLGD